MTGRIWQSAIVAAFFGVHPLHVESVAWISERKDVVSTFFLLVLLLFYERYARSPNLIQMACICVVYSMGLLAKSMLVTVPILLLLVDRWPLCRWPSTRNSMADDLPVRKYPSVKWQSLFAEKLPLVLLAIVDGVMTIGAQRSESAVISLDAVAAFGRILNAVDAIRWYLSKTFVPTGLCAFYPHPGMTDLNWIEHNWWHFLGSMAIVTFLSGLLVWMRNRAMTFGWLWFLISLGPVIGLIQVGDQAYADRYTYVPHIGLFIGIVWGTYRWSRKSAVKSIAISVFLLAGLTSCVLLSQFQMATWRTSETLWRHALRVNPSNIVARLNLGVDLLEQSRIAEANEQFTAALRVFPMYGEAIYHLGIASELEKDDRKAIAYYEWLLRMIPKHLGAQQRLTILYQRFPPKRQRHIPDGVRREIESGIQKGSRFMRHPDWESAVAHFRQAISLDRKCSEAMKLAAVALEELGRFDEARMYLEEAIQNDPNDVEAWHALDRVNQKLENRQ